MKREIVKEILETLSNNDYLDPDWEYTEYDIDWLLVNIEDLNEGDSVSDLINRYKNSTNHLFKAFGVDNGYGEIDDQTKSKWIGDDYINYFRYESDEWVQYSYDSANVVGTNGDYVMHYVYDNGEQYYVIFDKKMEISEEEYEQLEN